MNMFFKIYNLVEVSKMYAERCFKLHIIGC